MERYFQKFEKQANFPRNKQRPDLVIFHEQTITHTNNKQQVEFKILLLTQPQPVIRSKGGMFNSSSSPEVTNSKASRFYAGYTLLYYFTYLS